MDTITNGSKIHRGAGVAELRWPARVALTLAVAGLLIITPASLHAQRTGLAAGDNRVFDPLPLPTPNAVRDASGAPGPRYWQQRADYALAATLDTAAHSVSGTETIHYTNNSPDTLRFLWLQVDQNIYRSGSLGSFLSPENSRFGGGGEAGGMSIRSARVGGRELTPYIHDTMMRLDLPHPLGPGGSTDIAFEWSFPVPEHGSDRMGRDGSLYEVAQWYPRMVVYDDVRGWNTDPYLGQGEFYLEYGNFDVALTVPAGYVLAATGTLQNPTDVLTPAERQRLARARRSREKVEIISATEAGSAATRPGVTGTLTWRFRANNTRDFAWAGAPDFRWDALSDEGTTCHAFYRAADTAWTAAADMTCFSIHDYSHRWFPYPYPQATSIAGPVDGMEYPMIVFVGGRGSGASFFDVITHEIGHEWYPMTVGSDERRYAWMDEGFNTFINTWTNEERYPESKPRAAYRRDYDAYLAAGGNQPMMTPPDRVLPRALGVVGYFEPALVLHILRDEVLGHEVFDAAFREYTRRWAFKHPQPADFFRTMEDVSGRDLSWFFREWFYDVAGLDQLVRGVEVDSTAGGFKTTISLASEPPMVMPVSLEVTLRDGTKRDLSLPVDIWYYGPQYSEILTLPSRPLMVMIDPQNRLPDQDRANNLWLAPGAQLQVTVPTATANRPGPSASGAGS